MPSHVQNPTLQSCLGSTAREVCRSDWTIPLWHFVHFPFVFSHRQHELQPIQTFSLKYFHFIYTCWTRRTQKSSRTGIQTSHASGAMSPCLWDLSASMPGMNLSKNVQFLLHQLFPPSFPCLCITYARLHISGRETVTSPVGSPSVLGRWGSCGCSWRQTPNALKKKRC